MRLPSVHVLPGLRLRLPATLLAASLSLLAESFAQDAYWSLEGDFQNATDTQDLRFDLLSSVGSGETLFSNTLSHSGGTNQAGFSVGSGGFDPVLSLFDDSGTPHGSNNDGFPFVGPEFNRDAYLTWLGQAPNGGATGAITSDPLPVDTYEIELSAFAGSFPSPWAADLVGPASKMVLSGSSPSGDSSVDSLKFGTSGAGSNPAIINIAQFETLDIGDEFFVGNTGKAALNSLGTISSGDTVLGQAPGSEGSVTLTGSGHWTVDDESRIWDQGRGTLLIEGGASAEFEQDLFLAWFGSGQGDVTVTGNNSQLVVSGDLEVGDGGTGSLMVAQGGWVNSSDVGALGRDVIGDATTSNGMVTVTGSNSRWDTDGLLVADGGDGTLHIEAGGRVNSTSAEIGRTSPTATGDAMVTGANSLWDITTALWVGGDDGDQGPGGTGTVTAHNGGVVAVGNRLHVWNSGTASVDAASRVDVGTGVGPAGTLTVHSGGRLSGDGMVVATVRNDGGTVSPGEDSGDLATLTVEGSYWQTDSGSLEIDVTSTGTVSSADHLSVNGGNVMLDGTLTVLPVAGVYADPFTRGGFVSDSLVTAPVRTGTFAAVSFDADLLEADFGTDTDGSFRDHVGTVGSGFTPGLFRNVTYTSSEVQLTHYLAREGDANGDMLVTASGDGAILLANFGAGLGTQGHAQGDKDWADADFNGDGQVTASGDGATLLGNLGPDTAMAVPEPAIGLLTICGAATVALCHRRRKGGAQGCTFSVHPPLRKTAQR